MTANPRDINCRRLSSSSMAWPLPLLQGADVCEGLVLLSLGTHGRTVGTNGGRSATYGLITGSNTAAEHTTGHGNICHRSAQHSQLPCIVRFVGLAVALPVPSKLVVVS
jgi:hypothetical protein